MKKIINALIILGVVGFSFGASKTDNIKKIKIFSDEHSTHYNYINIQLMDGTSLYVRRDEIQKNAMLSLALTAYTTDQKVSVVYNSGMIDQIILDKTQQ